MTDEPADLVNDWIEKAKPEYPIATLRGGLESFLQVQGFPSCAVIDSEGTVLYSGFTGSEGGALGDALAKTKKQPLWPKSLAKITKLMIGDPSRAYTELKKLSGVAEEDRSIVDGFVAYLEGQAGQALTRARGFRDQGFVLKALDTLEPFHGSEPDFPSGAEAERLQQELRELPDLKKELAGGKAYAEAEQLEKGRDYEEAFETYKAVYKKFSGTKIAENARARAEGLRSDGMPGFSSSCEDCYSARRACEKHRKDVKL